MRRLVFASSLAAAGCEFRPTAFDPRAALEPGGACWEVDLGDGIDESSTAELHTLYDCLDQGGLLAPLAGLDAAMDETGRAGAPLGVEVATLVNDLGTLGVDVWGLAGFAIALLRDEERPFETLAHVAVEALYGRPWAEVSAGAEIRTEDALDAGLVRPALPVLGAAAGVILDEGDEIPAFIEDALASETTADAICSFVGLARSEDEGARALADDLLYDLGTAIAAARSPANDRWSGASGDSLRDLAVTALVEECALGGTPLGALRPPLGRMLGDVTLGHRVEQTLAEAEAGGHVDPLPLQLLYLAEVDAEGAPLAAGDDSALTALLRLLHSGDTEVDCTVSIAGYDLIEIALGNLSEELLRALADLDPSTVESGVELLGTVLGWDLSRSLLDAIADSGACPAIDAQLVSDLQSIDRFNDPQVGDLLVVFLSILQAFDAEGEDNRIPDLVDLLGAVWATGLAPPVEEVLRDLADTAIAGDLTDLVPLVLDPSPLAVDACPTGAAPLEFADAWALLADLVDDTGGLTAIDHLEPLLVVVLGSDATWTVAGNAGALLREPGAEIALLPDLAAALVEVDPDLEALHTLAPLAGEPAVTGPVLRVAENEPFLDALGRTAVEAEGPLPFFARLVLDGTLDSVLRTVDLVLAWLDGLEDSP